MRNKSRYLASLILIPILLAGCTGNQDQEDSDLTDYRLGAIGAFGEMVNAGVKRLALSSTLTTEEMDIFYPKAMEVAERNSVELHRETDLIVTDLFPADIAAGLEVLLIYQGETKNAYYKLKADKEKLENEGKYEGEARREIARRFGRMLSYSPRKINRLLTENTDFRVMDDFGITASNTFLYYDDLPAATDFYTKTLGIELIAEYDNASILRVSASSYLILVDAAKGMHSTDEPKSVALALLTDQLSDWYQYLKEKKVKIKYDYNPGVGGPHDGFVAVDPEGYLLEFEEFKEHYENEYFMPYLDEAETIFSSPGSNAPAGLGFKSSITWLYHKDLQMMENFYQNVMGLELVGDQGWTKIYRVSDTGFIGLVDERRGMNKFSEEKAVTVSFIIDDLDGWYEYVKEHDSFELRSEEVGEGPDGRYRAFVGYGPEGYFLEFDRFYEHEDNNQVMKYLYGE